MRLVMTKSLKPGSVLAQTIHNENGLVLLRQGITLSETMIERLTRQGITYVYIEDESTKDIYVNLAIPYDLRINATKTIKETFRDLKSQAFTDKSYLFNKKEKKLTTIVEQIANIITREEEAISLLADILVTDDYTFQHSLNVTIYALALGTKLKLSNKELIELGIGSILHDIGKLFIEEDILKKPDKLSDKEYEIMKQHAQLGFDYIRHHTDLPTVVAHCAYQHHERLDGSGYPRQLKDKDIHIYGKILGISDVFDAVTSNRVYREAMLPSEGLEILYAGAVSKFDKKMVELFKQSIVIYPNGITVELNDGRVGVVVRQNKHLYDRPIIRILRQDEKDIASPYDMDLSQVLDVTICSCHV